MRRMCFATAVFCSLTFVVFAPLAGATEIILTNVGTSTGDNLDGISNTPTLVAVAEIAGLSVTASTGVATETLNSLSTSFGVDTDGSGDDSDRTEGSESFTFVFNKAVTISQIDFIGLDSSATFVLDVGSTTINISEGDLSNASSDIYTPTGGDATTLSNITAGTSIGFSVSSGVVGLQGISLNVVPQPASLALLGLGGLMLVTGRRRAGDR